VKENGLGDLKMQVASTGMNVSLGINNIEKVIITFWYTVIIITEYKQTN